MKLYTYMLLGIHASDIGEILQYIGKNANLLQYPHETKNLNHYSRRG